MTTPQIRKYRAEWGRAYRALRAGGWPPARAEARRHELHVKALGFDKPSAELTNREFDLVLREFHAISDGGDLNRQIALDEMGERRGDRARARIRTLELHLGIEAGREHAYVQGIARKVLGTDQLGSLDEAQLGRLEGIVVARLRQLHTPARVAEIRAQADEDAGEWLAITARALPAVLVAVGDTEDGNPY